MAAKLSVAQSHKLDTLKAGSPVLRVEFFDYAMDGKVALVQRIVRHRPDPARWWSHPPKTEMYRVYPDGTTHGV